MKKKTLYNECAQCKERWQVVGSQSGLTWDDIHLDTIDKQNLKDHGQLYSVCEDCSEHGDCYSIKKELSQ